MFKIYCIPFVISIFTFVASSELNETCPLHMELSSCAQFYTCSNYTREAENCTEACSCIDGYVHDFDDPRKCILKSQCKNPPLCEKFEVFENWGFERNCDSISELYNFDGCHCKRGYIRKDKDCVPEKFCKTNCSEKMQFSEKGPHTPLTCDNFPYYQYLTSISTNTSGCFCISPYVLDQNTNKCVFEKDCSTPPSCMDDNEYFSESGYDMECKAIIFSERSNHQIQNRGCFCKYGYARDVIGLHKKCIPIDDCEGCEENKVVNIHKKVTTCETKGTQHDLRISERRCVCKPDYTFENVNSTKCVKIEDCTVPTKCLNVNETFKLDSRDVFCHGEVTPYDEQTLKPSCYCKDGYARNYSGVCILSEECPQAFCSKNQIYQITPRDISCFDILKNKIPTYTKKIPGCHCKDGFVRDHNRVFGENCVPPSECVYCSANQSVEINPCVHTCKTWSSFRCESGLHKHGPVCHCKQGYVYENDETNRCILLKDCPRPINCSENKEFKTKGQERYCKKVQQHHVDVPDEERDGCFCKEGWLKYHTLSSICVPEKDCDELPDCGRHEEVAMFGSCLDTCETYKSGSWCWNVTEPNSKMCVCKSGYVWSSESNKTCIPVNYCAECSSDNEIFMFNGPNYEQTCSNWSLLPLELEDFGSSPTHSENTKAGCFCKYGFIRDCDNNCVTNLDCPIPSCPGNQTFLHTGRELKCGSDEMEEKLNVFQCYCNPGYSRNYKNACILTSDCDNCTANDPNSFYSPCVHSLDFCNGSKITSWDCLSNCDCLPGYLIDKNGKCVTECECDTV